MSSATVGTKTTPQASKRIVIDQAPRFCPATGMATALREAPGAAAKNKYLAELLKEKGGRDAFTHVPGDLSIMESEGLLVVPEREGEPVCSSFTLPGEWNSVTKLEEQTDRTEVTREADGSFHEVPPGIYRMLRGE